MVISYYKFTRTEAGKVTRTEMLVKMSAYNRRALFPHPNSGVFWTKKSGACEGVAIAHFIR